MSALAQAIQHTTKGFLQGFVDASQAKNTRLFLRSVGAPPDLKMTNTQYEADFGTMEFYVFEKHDFHDLTIDTENLKAAVRSDLVGTFRDGKKLERTFVWFLNFNEDGSKIVRVYQHNDSEEGRNHRVTIKEYYDAKEKASKDAKHAE